MQQLQHREYICLRQSVQSIHIVSATKCNEHVGRFNLLRCVCHQYSLSCRARNTNDSIPVNQKYESWIAIPRNANPTDLDSCVEYKSSSLSISMSSRKRFGDFARYQDMHELCGLSVRRTCITQCKIRDSNPSLSKRAQDMHAKVVACMLYYKHACTNNQFRIHFGRTKPFHVYLLVS